MAGLVSITLTGNNADKIGDALASVVEWVDVCLVVDTGVTDESLTIARAVAGAKYVERSFPWVNDFAAARNFGLDVANSLEADWAVILDTDERIDLGFTNISSLLAAEEAQVLLAVHESGNYVKDRFFRLPARGRYIGPTHEYYDAGTGSRRVIGGVRFLEVEKSAVDYQAKFERDAEILSQHVKTHPSDARWFYYLGDALQSLHRYNDAIDAYQSCAALRGWDEEAAWACYRAAECWIALGEHDKALESCSAGLAHHAGLAELPWLAGFICWKVSRFQQAIAWERLSIAAGNFRGSGTTAARFGFRYPFALYEGPYDVMRFAFQALGDSTAAEEAERLFRHAAAAREADMAAWLS